MKTDSESAQQALLNAQQAVRQGDRQAARRCAEIAAALCPDLEEPWLILAAVGSPHASVAYLERALQINPHSERARMGMHWAVDRLRKEKARSKNAGPPDKPSGGGTSQSDSSLQSETRPLVTRKLPVTVAATPPAPTPPLFRSDAKYRWSFLILVDRLRKEMARSKNAGPPDKPAGGGTAQSDSSQEADTRPLVTKKISVTVAATPPAPTPSLFKSFAKYRWSFLTLLVLAVCVTAAWVFWPGNAAPVLAFLHVPQSLAPGFGAPVKVDKPTYTPTFTSTFTPTDTFTPSPTFTLTPSPTATYTPTETFTPTLKPWPTNTPRPPRPTNTPEVADYSGRWIDVNLSQQMVYAYEGNSVVASFLVSTGVSAFPTVTGQFHIYIKLESTLMAGDGYYLPNVPYTMYFYKGYGLHGTYWHSNFGHPMSHGCVNMYTPDAQWLFYWASVGTLVNIHY